VLDDVWALVYVIHEALDEVLVDTAVTGADAAKFSRAV
jgi:hypothetical protein